MWPLVSATANAVKKYSAANENTPLNLWREKNLLSSWDAVPRPPDWSVRVFTDSSPSAGSGGRFITEVNGAVKKQNTWETDRACAVKYIHATAQRIEIRKTASVAKCIQRIGLTARLP